MTTRASDYRAALASADGATFAWGIALGTALAFAVILVLMSGPAWSLLVLAVLGGALTLWLAASVSGIPGDRRHPSPERLPPAFTDWSADGLLGAFGDSPASPAAPALASATSPARSTFVDTQA
jgi:hypothetical protein